MDGRYPLPGGVARLDGGVRDRFVRLVLAQHQLTTPRQAADYLAAHVFPAPSDREQEEFWTLVLNCRNIVTHEIMLYRGTISTAHVRMAEVFRDPLRLNAAAIMLAHFHPSGDESPSPEDIHVTRQAIQAAELLDVHLLDHVIVGTDNWVSLRDRLGLDWNTS